MKVLVVGLACALLVGIAVPASGAVADSDMEVILDGIEIDHPVVGIYADEFGISREEAVDNLRMQKDLNDLAGELSVAFPEIFAGASFENGGDFAFRVLSTESTKELTEAIDRFLAEHAIPAETVSVQPAALNVGDQLKRIDDFNRSASLVKDLPDFAVTIDPASGDIIVIADDTEDMSSRLAPLRAEYGVRVEYRGGVPEESATCPHHNGWLEGGRRMMMTTGSVPEDCGGSASICSSGFTIMVDGYQGILTAGHCAGSNSTHWATIQYADGDTDFTDTVFRRQVTCCYADAQANREKWASSGAQPRIYLWDQYWRTIDWVAQYSADNMYLCAKGGNTAEVLGSHSEAYMCGRVSAENIDVDGTGPLKAAGWAQLHLTYHPHWRGGDSGGPVFIVNDGHGIGTHMAGNGEYVDFNKLTFALGYTNSTLLTP
jgi:hypothetical protein